MPVTSDQKTKTAFGKAVRKIRTDAGLSQEKLAEVAGLNRTYVGDVERGERNVSVVNMQKIAKALRVPLSQIVKEMEKFLGRSE